MTQEERIRAVVDCGFTERQARFLVLVMRHGGVCIPRQYASFAGIANGGRRCNAFFDRLVKRGYAHEIRCVHNRARVYHVHHKPLYFLIGEASSRYRRPVSPRAAVERLMLLDAVLAVGEVEWLTTAAEKAAYLEGLKAKATDDRPQQSMSDEARPRPSPPSSVLPIGVVADGRMLLLYLASEPQRPSEPSFRPMSCCWRSLPPGRSESCVRGRSTMPTTRIRRSSMRSSSRPCIPRPLASWSRTLNFVARPLAERPCIPCRRAS
jgi:hypothetical protein